MKGLGIVHPNGIEIIDITVNGSTITPERCPGELRKPCNECCFLRTEARAAAEAVMMKHPRSARKRLPVITCHWHEQSSEERPSV